MISGWPAILLAPLLLTVAIIAGLLPKPRPKVLTPAEVAGYISDLLEGSSGPWDWDQFENMTIADPALELIRERAARMGPPNPDIDGLQGLLNEMRATYSDVR